MTLRSVAIVVCALIALALQAAPETGSVGWERQQPRGGPGWHREGPPAGYCCDAIAGSGCAH
jgi:hypothetical protein